MNQEPKWCVRCGIEAYKNCYSEDGIKEFDISGLCEKCFDYLTKEIHED